LSLKPKDSIFMYMTLELKSQKIDKNKKNTSIKFSEEQLEILQDEYEKKCANEEMSILGESELIESYRAKYRVSKRDALDMIIKNN